MCFVYQTSSAVALYARAANQDPRLPMLGVVLLQCPLLSMFAMSPFLPRLSKLLKHNVWRCDEHILNGGWLRSCPFRHRFGKLLNP